jgi:hypothetical protein
LVHHYAGFVSISANGAGAAIPGGVSIADSCGVSLAVTARCSFPFAFAFAFGIAITVPFTVAVTIPQPVAVPFTVAVTIPQPVAATIAGAGSQSDSFCVSCTGCVSNRILRS